MALTIQLLGWNSADVLRKSLPKLAAIPKMEAQIVYIDNNSSDDSIRLVREYLPQATIIALSENIGYAGGHNVGFAMCQTEYVLVLNPDVALDWEGTQQLLNAIKQHSRVGAMQGLLMRPQSELVDSAGIVRTLTLNGIDRGAGKSFGPNFSQAAVVDATTGACSLLRMAALQQVSHGNYLAAGHEALEVFDKDFFAYKEDVDLGWRLQTAGWVNRFEPIRVGTHGRVLKRSGKLGWNLRPAALIARLNSDRTRMSLRNYVWLVVKNASFTQLLIHEVFVDVRLVTFLAFSLVFWPLLSIWPQVLHGLPNMLHKRCHEVVNNHR